MDIVNGYFNIGEKNKKVFNKSFYFLMREKARGHDHIIVH